MVQCCVTGIWKLIAFRILKWLSSFIVIFSTIYCVINFNEKINKLKVEILYHLYVGVLKASVSRFITLRRIENLANARRKII